MAREHHLVVGWGTTGMEGKNSYCVVKCVINEQCNRWSLSFCRAIKMRELAWKSPPTNAEV